MIDSSTLIKLKVLVKVDKQWNFLDQMMRLVKAGALCFPRQVVSELTGQRWPDAPGAWIGGAKDHVCHPQPSDEHVARVLAVAEKLVDADSTGREIADPYVVAMALSLSEQYVHTDVVVASDDIVDRLPLKESILSACTRLSLELWRPDKFIEWCDSMA